MALYQSPALVLHTYKLGDTDQIVVLFTQDFGKLRVVVRRSQNPRRHVAGYYQPLLLLNAIVYGRPGQALYRMHSVDLMQAFRPLHDDFALLRCGLYITELLDVATQEQAPAPDLFTLAHATLCQLMQTASPPMLLRVFELRLMVALGYTPQLVHCVQCTRLLTAEARAFSVRLGGGVCPACAAMVRPSGVLSSAALQYLHVALTEEAMEFPLPPLPVQEELEQLLHAYVTYRLGRALKSYPFLRL